MFDLSTRVQCIIAFLIFGERSTEVRYSLWLMLLAISTLKKHLGTQVIDCVQAELSPLQSSNITIYESLGSSRSQAS